jgi:hypothetical protein
MFLANFYYVSNLCRPVFLGQRVQSKIEHARKPAQKLIDVEKNI